MEQYMHSLCIGWHPAVPASQHPSQAQPSCRFVKDMDMKLRHDFCNSARLPATSSRTTDGVGPAPPHLSQPGLRSQAHDLMILFIFVYTRAVRSVTADGIPQNQTEKHAHPNTPCLTTSVDSLIMLYCRHSTPSVTASQSSSTGSLHACHMH